MRGVNSWEEKRHVRERSTEEVTGEAHGHVGEAEAVEYARVRILELLEVDVALDRLVLCARQLQLQLQPLSAQRFSSRALSASAAL